ncbi:MAG: group III truncated hemoglobin [Bdellovibrionaceae bacterium]|nr:group III truncated hemoglobin [Pseudobdellovibrionaceae bacterium]
MGSTKLIETRKDIDELVNAFYAKVRVDELIGPIFNDKIGDHWDEHLLKIQNFWEMLLLNGDSYRGRPFPPHIPLNLKVEHFQQWLKLFFETVDERFRGQKADEAKMRALNIGRNFLTNIQHYEKQRGDNS